MNQDGDQLKTLRLTELQPHPQNPRRIERRTVIDAIAAQLRAAGEFHPSHALLVRPLSEGYQIISGHNRAAAARDAGLSEVPAWVRDLDDNEAFMQLLLCNAQGELYSLEKGEHARLAVEGGMTLRAYAERIGVKEDTVQIWKWAADVAVRLKSDFEDLRGYMKHLSVIHAAPPEAWPELARQMVEREWTVEEATAAVKLQTQKRLVKSKAEGPKYILLDEWKQWTPQQRAVITDWDHRGRGHHFNRQDSDSIEWAEWSWNPVTGCLHNCPYCYARDFAARIYAQKFEPSLWPERLSMPYDTPLPAGAASDISLKNVFTCSMADLFGQWVPKEWIELVLRIVRENPQWNFLFLTKFPIRMAEFEYPPNAWLGTSVDLRARVKNAEKAMRNVKASVKWLSIEPLIEPLQFEDLSAFNWIVIGGASPSSQTPEWRPPRRWVWDLTLRAMDAGCLVYHKTNLANDRLKMFPGDPHPAQVEPDAAPPVFKYLKVIA